MDAHSDAMRVYVLWTPRGVAPDTLGPLVMQALAKRLDCMGVGRDNGGFSIPVRHRHIPWRPASESSAPRPIDFAGAQCNVVIALYDDLMAAREDWSGYLRQIYDTAANRNGADLLLPVLLTQDNSSPAEWPRVQGIRPPSVPEEPGRAMGHPSAWLQRLLIGLLSRMLDKARSVANRSNGADASNKVRIFLSHAKRDGADAALLIQAFGRLKPDSTVAGVELFFDAADTLAGSRYDDQFRTAIQQSVFLAIVTDAYHGRPWCQWELLLAKQLQRPILIWDLSREGTARSFPYLGNVPVVRSPGLEPMVPGAFDESVVEWLLTQLLAEALRMQVWEQYARGRIALRAGMDAAQVRVFARPPELTDVAYQCRGCDNQVIVYPDPPIGHDERELLAAANPAVRFVSLSELID